MMLELSKLQIEILRRRSWVQLQKLSMEIARHKQQFPNGLEDPEYLEQTQQAIDLELELFNTWQNALKPLAKEAKK